MEFGEALAIGFHPRGVECVSFAWGQVISSGLDETVQAWDPDEGRAWSDIANAPRLQSMGARGQLVASLHAYSIAILDDDGHMAMGPRNGPVTVVNAVNRTAIRGLEFEAEPFTKAFGFCALTTSPDGQWIAGTNRTYATVWNRQTGAMVWRSDAFMGGQDVFFCDQGTRLYVIPWQNELRTVQWGKSESLKKLQVSALHGNILSATPSKDGRRIFVATTRPKTSLPQGDNALDFGLYDNLAIGDDLEVDLDGTWDGQALPKPSIPPRLTSPTSSTSCHLLALNRDNLSLEWQCEVPGRIHDVVALPDNQTVLCAGTFGQIEAWRFGQKVAHLDLSSSPLMQEMISSAHAEEMATSAPWLEEDVGPAHTVHCLSLADDSKQIAAGLACGAVIIAPLLGTH